MRLAADRLALDEFEYDILDGKALCPGRSHCCADTQLRLIDSVGKEYELLDVIRFWVHMRKNP